MIKDLQRIIKKGASDSLLNSKIVEFHKQLFDSKNIDIRNEYYQLKYKYEINEQKSIENIEGSEDKLDALENMLSINEEIEDLEGLHPWLLNTDDEDLVIIPVFSMTEEEITAYRVENYTPLRSAAYDAKNQFELIADDLFDTHIAAVKARFPKV